MDLEILQSANLLDLDYLVFGFGYIVRMMGHIKFLRV